MSCRPGLSPGTKIAAASDVKSQAMGGERVLQLDSNDMGKWALILEESPEIIVNYHSKIDCPACSMLYSIFVRLAMLPSNREILFVSIDTDNNPIADQYIRRKRLPFLAAFKNGILIECNNVQSEKGMTEMLERLVDYKLKL